MSDENRSPDHGSRSFTGDPELVPVFIAVYYGAHLHSFVAGQKYVLVDTLIHDDRVSC